ncbi:hypothetical protein AcW1_003805 [Taiwanofungus camphoratus]|nr:hypothetical protein AcV5_003511 [Antrodia cinnamomea]KAI0940671.1 hypothetical protein AcW1_003805 [Antrodia cinnamomea]KAI0958156.1 hypothetical protein AcV7_004048 [Antrodia cinnamomea]
MASRDSYAPEMEDLGAGAVFRLLNYHHACGQAESTALDLQHLGPSGDALEWLSDVEWSWCPLTILDSALADPFLVKAIMGCPRCRHKVLDDFRRFQVLVSGNIIDGNF